MTDLVQFAHYTGAPPAPAAPSPAQAAHAPPAKRRAAHPRPLANGGATGPLNSARIGALRIAPLRSSR